MRKETSTTVLSVEVAAGKQWQLIGTYKTKDLKFLMQGMALLRSCTMASATLPVFLKFEKSRRKWTKIARRYLSNTPFSEFLQAHKDYGRGEKVKIQ